MKILALDLGSTTGWAVVEDGKVLQYGEQNFPGGRHQRLQEFLFWLQDLLSGHGLGDHHVHDVVIYERPFCRGLHATRSLWGMAGIVEGLSSRSAACLDIVPTTIKKWATGSGRADKERMVQVAEVLIYPDERLLREHEADAIILGLYAAENIEPGE